MNYSFVHYMQNITLFSPMNKTLFHIHWPLKLLQLQTQSVFPPFLFVKSMQYTNKVIILAARALRNANCFGPIYLSAENEKVSPRVSTNILLTTWSKFRSFTLTHIFFSKHILFLLVCFLQNRNGAPLNHICELY